MNHRTRGFTLVETLVVIAVISILASVALVSFQPFVTRARIDNAITESGALIRLAVSEARRTNQNTTVTFTGSTMRVSRAGATVRQATLDVTPTVRCRTTCPTTYTFSSPFGTNATDFNLTFTRGGVSRDLTVRGPLALVSVK